jgi:DNA-binding NarL/FixJ family response regulator
MKTKYNIYLALDCQILLSGFESLIKSKFNPSTNIEAFNSVSDVLSFDFSQNPEFTNLLIFDCSLQKGINNAHFIDFLKKFPDLRTMVLVEEFKLEKIKFLFSIGINGVLDRNIKADDFLTMLNQTFSGKKSLSPEYKKRVLKNFCKTMSDQSGVMINEPDMYQEKKNEYIDQLFKLTKREKEVLCLISEGKNTKEISEDLFISLHTVETHRRNLLEKLNAKNTAEMVKVAMVNNLILVEAY